MRWYDFHTHMAPTDPDVTALISSATAPAPTLHRQYWSLEVHPWLALTELPEDFLEKLPKADALGETGLDRMRGAEWATQLRLFTRMAELAHENAKPLVIHGVRALAEVLQLRRRFPDDTWLLHGWRSAKRANLNALLQAGIRVSLDHRAPDALSESFAGRLHLLGLESDMAPEVLQSSYQKTAHALQLPVAELQRILEENFWNLFKSPMPR